MADSVLPAPCSLRQGMYMFPERFAKDFQGNPFREQIDVTLFGGAAKLKLVAP